MKLLLAVMITLPIFAAEKPAPKLSDEWVIRFFKARAETAEAQNAVAAAQATVTDKQAALNTVINEGLKVCPLKYDDKGFPMCATPEPPKKEEKK